jgi:hypothetical protein
MNEQIKKLAGQARLLMFTDDKGNHYVSDGNLQRFAELIVRDVVDTVKRTQITSPDFEWAILNNYHLEIKE